MSKEQGWAFLKVSKAGEFASERRITCAPMSNSSTQRCDDILHNLINHQNEHLKLVLAESEDHLLSEYVRAQSQVCLAGCCRQHEAD